MSQYHTTTTNLSFFNLRTPTVRLSRASQQRAFSYSYDICFANPPTITFSMFYPKRTDFLLAQLNGTLKLTKEYRVRCSRSFGAFGPLLPLPKHGEICRCWQSFQNSGAFTASELEVATKARSCPSRRL